MAEPDLVHPEFVPGPDRSREEMEAQQRKLIEIARFDDDHGVDPESIAVGSAFELGGGLPEAGRERRQEPGQERLPGMESDDLPIVVGVDQAFLEDCVVSGIVALQGDIVVEYAHAVSPLSIPYIPGLLAFREGGPILDAFANLTVDPDLVVFDGSGRIHYRQAGIATHVGVVLDVPSVGVAKNLLCGEPDEPVADRPEGWSTPIRVDEEVEAPDGTILGHAYQSRQYPESRRINPLYVSPGHRVSADRTVELVAALCAGYKLPEPTRLADAYAGRVRNKYEDGQP